MIEAGFAVRLTQNIVLSSLANNDPLRVVSVDEDIIPRRFIRYPEMVARGYFRNRPAADRAIAAGLIPAPYELGPNQIGWAEDELEEADRNRPRRKARMRVAS